MAKAEKELPPIDLLEGELKKERYRRRFGRALRSTVYSLLVVAAVAVLVAMLVLPVLQIIGTSMTDTLEDGDIVIAIRGSGYGKGDVVAFYYNNNILIKRVIATSGDWVDIDSEGNVSVNGEWLDEPYVSEKAFGECDLTLPYQVPEGRSFLMGDHRGTSIDSRSTTVGCISDEMIVGRLFIRVWPLPKFGWIY